MLGWRSERWLRFVTEASVVSGSGAYRLQDLHRAGAFELRVVGAVNEAHGTLPDEVLDLYCPSWFPVRSARPQIMSHFLQPNVS